MENCIWLKSQKNYPVNLPPIFLLIKNAWNRALAKAFELSMTDENEDTIF